MALKRLFHMFHIFSYSLRNFHDSKHTYSKDLCSCEARRAISDLTDTAAWNALEFEVIFFHFLSHFKRKKTLFSNGLGRFQRGHTGSQDLRARG